MEKIVEVGSWGGIDVNPVELVKVSRHGLTGNDRREFLQKRAAANIFADHLNNVKLAEDEYPIHLIAVCATEGYGCFAAGTPFALADGGYIPIEQVQVGDNALSADGHACEVTYLFRRRVEQSLRLDICGLGDTLHCSTDHPFRVARKEQFTCQHDRYKRCLPPTQGQQNICRRPKAHVRDCVESPYPHIQYEWATANSLQEGDFLVWTAPDLEPLWVPSVDEGYLLGAWLAEGCFQRNSSNRQVASIRLDIHRQEGEFQERLQRAATVLGLQATVYTDLSGDKYKNCALVRITGDPARFRLWHATFGEHSHNKIVPPWLCCLPQPVRLAVIAGYLDGDGCCVVDTKENRTTARTHGRDLSLGMQRLCWSAGLPAVRCSASDDGWNLSIANSYLGELVPFSWKVRGRDLKQTTKVHGFYHKGRMHLPIRAIVPAGPADVFNLEVGNDHTYSGPNVDSHNCNRNGDGFTEKTCQAHHDSFVKHARHYRNHKNKDPAKSYGPVKLSAYNNPMRRVELLIVGNGSEKAAERNGGLVLPDSSIQALKNGDDLPYSMACKIAFDICCNCFNKASSRREYCTEDTCVNPHNGRRMPGCRHGLTKLGADGFQQYVDNPNPIWFDISEVWRPADRAAYGGMADYLTKAASAGYTPGGAELAEMWAAQNGMSFELLPPDATRRQRSAARQADLAYKLAAVEAKIEKQATEQDRANARAFVSSTQNPIDLGPLGPVDSRNLATGLQALAQQKVALPLRDYVRLSLGEGEKTAALLADVSRHLPGVFGRLAASENLTEQLQSNPYIADGSRTAPATQRVWAKQAAAEHSLDEEAVRQRVWRSVFHKTASPEITFRPGTKCAAENGPAEELARGYALYKLAFLDAVCASEPEADLDWLCSMVVYQNHAV